MIVTRFRFVAVALFALSALASCKTDPAVADAQAGEVATEGEVVVPEAEYSTEPDSRSPEEIAAELNAGGRAGDLEAFPAAEIEKLRSTVTKIDLVFFKDGVSMSLDNPQAVAYALNAVSPTKATRKPNCQPVARMFMSAGKESAAEADVFFSNGCTYFEVFEDKKPSYVNEMTPAGKSFFNDNLGQAIPGFQRVN